MKTIKYICFATAAVLAISCAKEKEGYLTPAQQAGERVTIKVSTSEEMLGKVSMSEASDRKAMNLAWESTDKLSVNGEEFSVTNIISAHEAEFDGTAPASSPYTIIYPGKYTDAAAFNARSYAGQAQSGNSSTAHLEYNAMLSGVTAYLEPKFDPDWAADNGGTLVQNGVIQLRVQLPDAVTAVNSITLIASRAVFPTTNEGTEKVKEQTLTLSSVSPTSHIVEAYMMFSAAGVVWQAGDKLTVAVNTPDAMYVRELPAMTAQTWEGGGQYTIQCKALTENSFEINNATDLEEFRDGVNSGDFLWQYCHVSVKADIDCSGISSWTPIGNGTFNTSDYSVSGNVFHGSFDGENHVLKNFQMNGTPAENAPYGLFGILDGATVKNLVFGASSGDTGFFKVTPTASMEAGILAGVCRGSKVQNVFNYSPMSILTNTSTAAAFFGMVGYVVGTSAGDSYLYTLKNYGEINAHGGNNTNNGGTGFNVGGIVGFSHTNKSGVRNGIENCWNYGNITSNTGRVAGILAAANTRTWMMDCTNYGNIENDFSNSRVGGICVIMVTNCDMTGCANYGRIVVKQSNSQLGGLVCLLNAADVNVTACANHGLIVGDITSYRGTLIANFSNFNAVDGLTAGGAVASYNGGDYQFPAVLTSENYLSYIGKIKAGFESKVTNITFEAWDGYPAANETKISNVSELLAFAAKVNAGEFTASDVAKLTADIDCSGISSWTPIGNCTLTTWTYKNLGYSGNPFVGTFDGQNHTISNLDFNFTSTDSFSTFGFFGMIGDGATVKDLVFDNTCSMAITASYGSPFGILAGIVMGATVSNVENHASITGGGTASLPNGANGWLTVGGLVGDVHMDSTPATLSGLKNYGNIGTDIADFSRGNNSGSGGTGVHVGGIAGFSTNNYETDTNNSTRATFTSCENYGDIYTNAGRSSGIVAALTRPTTLKDCVNHGNMVSSFNGTARLGLVTCYSNANSVLDGCINYGNLTALDCASVAGVICGFGGVITVKDCASLGATILGKSVNLSGNQTYNGVLFGYCNNASTFSGCRVSGYFGTSDSNKVALTAENYFQYVGQFTNKCTTCTTTNITFAP